MNGSRKPAASPTSSQPSPAAPRHGGAHRPNADEPVGDRWISARWRRSGAAAPSRGSRVATGSGAVGRSARRPRRSEHDPDVDPVARHRREADVAVAKDDHPRIRRVACRLAGVARPGRGRSSRSRARVRRAAWPRPRSRATMDRSPSAPDDDRRLELERPSATSGALADDPRPFGRRARPVRPRAPRARPRPPRRAPLEQQGRVERAPVEPDRRVARGRPSRRRSGGTRRRRASRRASPERAARTAQLVPRPARCAAAPRRPPGQAKTPHARQRQRGARSSTTTSWPRPASSAAVAAPAGPATDDGDLDRSARGHARHRRDRPPMARETPCRADRPQPGLAEQRLGLRGASRRAAPTAAPSWRVHGVAGQRRGAAATRRAARAGRARGR